MSSEIRPITTDDSSSETQPSQTSAGSLGIDRENFTPEELALRLRQAINQLPDSEPLKNLIHWNDSNRAKKKLGIQTPPVWIEMMNDLTINERMRVTRTIRILDLYIGRRDARDNIAISDLKNFEWSANPFIYKIGPQSQKLIRESFQVQPEAA